MVGESCDGSASSPDSASARRSHPAYDRCARGPPAASSAAATSGGESRRAVNVYRALGLSTRTEDSAQSGERSLRASATRPASPVRTPPATSESSALDRGSSSDQAATLPSDQTAMVSGTRSFYLGNVEGTRKPHVEADIMVLCAVLSRREGGDAPAERGLVAGPTKEPVTP